MVDDLDREGRIFRPAQLEERQYPADRDQQDQKQGDGALADGQRRQIESAVAHGCFPSRALLAVVARRIAWPREGDERRGPRPCHPAGGGRPPGRCHPTPDESARVPRRPARASPGYARPPRLCPRRTGRPAAPARHSPDARTLPECAVSRWCPGAHWPASLRAHSAPRRYASRGRCCPITAATEPIPAVPQRPDGWLGPGSQASDARSPAAGRRPPGRLHEPGAPRSVQRLRPARARPGYRPRALRIGHQDGITAGVEGDFRLGFGSLELGPGRIRSSLDLIVAGDRDRPRAP